MDCYNQSRTQSRAYKIEAKRSKRTAFWDMRNASLGTKEALCMEEVLRDRRVEEVLCTHPFGGARAEEALRVRSPLGPHVQRKFCAHRHPLGTRTTPSWGCVRVAPLGGACVQSNGASVLVALAGTCVQ